MRIFLLLVAFCLATDSGQAQPASILWAHGAGPWGANVLTSLQASKADHLVFAMPWWRWKVGAASLSSSEGPSSEDGFCSVFTRHDSEVIAGTSDGSIYAWDVHQNQFSLVSKVSSNSIRCIAATSDGNYIAAFTEGDWIVHLYDRVAQKEVASWRNAVGPVQFSPDGMLLLAGLENGYHKSIALIDVATQKIIRWYLNIDIPIAIRFNPVQRGIFAIADGKGIRVMDTAGNVDASWPIVTMDNSDVISYSPDGSMLAAAYASLAILRPSDGTISVLPGGALLVSFLDNDTLVATNLQAVDLYSAKNLSFLGYLSGHNGGVGTVQFSRDGSRLLSIGGGAFKIWDSNTGAVLDEDENQRGGYLSTASNDLHNIIEADEFGTLSFFSGIHDSGRVIREGESSDTGVNIFLAFSPLDSVFAVGTGLYEFNNLYEDARNAVELWSASSEKKIRTLDGPHYPVTHIAFSHDGSRLAASFEGLGLIYVWDVMSGSLLDSTQQLDTTFDWSAIPLPGTDEGAFIQPSYDVDSSIYIIDRQSGATKELLSASGESLLSLDVNHATGDIATGGADGSIIVWKALNAPSAVTETAPPSTLPLQAIASASRITIRIPGDGGQDAPPHAGQVRVYNALGVCCFAGAIHPGESSVTTGALPAGAYFIVFKPASGQPAFTKVSLFQ